MFIYKILNNYTDCNEILQNININLPPRKIKNSKYDFYIKILLKNINKTYIIIRVCGQINSIKNNIDIYNNSSLYQFKYKIKEFYK